MASQKPSRSVFVGNIPYDATEEQLRAICEQVGPVVSFRLVTDRETGKAKGFGFCEYKDEETAQSARRNLQGHDINGRQLRVDFAENEKGSGGQDRMPRGSMPAHQLPFSYEQLQHNWIPPTPPIPTQPSDSSLPPAQQPVGHAAAYAAAAAVNGALGGGSPQQLPASGLGNAGPPASDPLTSQLAGMSKQQLYDLLSQMKVLIQTNHAQARAILVANPQLTKGLFQAQVMLGMVKPTPLPASPQPPAQPRPPMQPQVQQASQPQPPPHTYQQQQQSTPAPLSQQPHPRPPAPPPPSQYQVPAQPPPQQPASRPPPTQPSGYPPSTGQPRYQQPVAVPAVPPMAYGQQPQQHQMQPQQQYQMNRSTPQQQILPPQRPLGPPGPTGPAPPPTQPMQVGGLAAPVGYPAQAPQHSMYSQGGVPPPSMQAAPIGRLPPPPPQTQAPTQAMDLEQQKQLLQQVMQLTPDQINSLPPEQRAQVLQLQQALR